MGESEVEALTERTPLLGELEWGGMRRGGLVEREGLGPEDREGKTRCGEREMR